MAYKKIEIDSGRKNAQNSDELIVNKDRRKVVRNMAESIAHYNMGYVNSYPTRPTREFRSAYQWLKEAFGSKKARDTMLRKQDSRNVTEKDRKRKNTL